MQFFTQNGGRSGKGATVDVHGLSGPVGIVSFVVIFSVIPLIRVVFPITSIKAVVVGE